MESGARLRIAVVSCLALVAMGGAVGWALAHRSDAGDLVKTGASRGPGPGNRIIPEEALPPGCEPDPANPATIVFDLPDGVLDLGSLKQGAVVEKDVSFRNVGSGRLCVGKPTTGCGCVKTELIGPQTYAPTETGAIRVRVDTTNREGPQDKDVKIATNDPSKKPATFKVKADVRLGVIATSTALMFGRHVKNHAATATLRLKSPKTDAPWAVTGVEGAGVTFTFVAKDVEPNDPVFRNVDVEVTHPGSPDLGPRTDPLKILTSHPDRPEIQVHSSLIVVDHVFAAPLAVPFGVVRQDLVTAPFPLRILGGEPGQQFKVTGVSIEGEGFLAGTPKQVSPGEWEIELRADTHGKPPGRVTGELVVTTDDVETREIRVKLRVEVLGPPAAPK